MWCLDRWWNQQGLTSHKCKLSSISSISSSLADKDPYQTTIFRKGTRPTSCLCLSGKVLIPPSLWALQMIWFHTTIFLTPQTLPPTDPVHSLFLSAPRGATVGHVVSFSPFCEYRWLISGWVAHWHKVQCCVFGHHITTLWKFLRHLMG